MVLGASLLALAACAGGPTSVPPVSVTPSPSASGTPIAGVAWLDGGHSLAIVSMGSSTCVPAAEAVGVLGQEVSVGFIPVKPDKACTADYGPRASFVSPTDGVDPAKDVTVTATGAVVGKATLKGLTSGTAATEQTPTAGWVEGAASDLSGAFAFVTWGSSTCVPSVSEVTSSGPSDVTVTLARTQPEGTACTMDMAPRAGIAVVPPTVTGSDVTVTFTGDGITGSTKMLGSR